MNLSEDERIRSNECLKKVSQTKFLCIQAIEYLLEQQREIDECIRDLRRTKINAEEINEKLVELNGISCLKFCFFSPKETIVQTNLNELLILPFPNQTNEMMYGLIEVEKDFQFSSMKNVYSEYSTKEDFERILHEEYTMLFELAKKLTKSVQILHDTIEFLGRDIKLTLDHMQLAQPRMKQLLQTKAPLAFAQGQNISFI